MNSTASSRVDGSRIKPGSTIWDVERLARESLSPAAWDSVEGGAHDERTIARNRAAYARWSLVPRHFHDVSEVSTATVVLGKPVEVPVLLAPIGAHQLAHPGAELVSAAAAENIGTVFCLSTGATRSIEEVAAATGGRRWFQLYHFGQDVSADLVARAEASGYEAIVVTVDVPVPCSSKERNTRRSYDPLASFDQANLGVMAGQQRRSFQPVTWDVLTWLRETTKLPLLVKGVLAADEARACVEHGVNGIVVSNHGGRMLDGVRASLDALPDVVDAVGESCEVFVDGGVRRGTDVYTALALGAHAVLIGRPFFYGLAAGGQSGVEYVLHGLQTELAHALAFSGCAGVSDISAAHVVREWA